MASIPLSSFLNSAAQVVTGLMQGKAAGEAAAAEQAQQQQELAMRQAQNRQQQEQFLQTLNLHQQQLSAEERHRQAEEGLRKQDIERKTAADLAKQRLAGEVNAGKADIAKARDWRQAQEFAAAKKQAALNRYYQTAPSLSQADRDAMWEATQDEISQYETFAATFASPYATAGQPPAAGGAAPADTGTPTGAAPTTGTPVTGTPPAGPVAPKKTPGRLTQPTPSQVTAKEKVDLSGRRLTDSEKRAAQRHQEVEEAHALTKRGQDLAASGRTTSHEDRQAVLDLRARHEKWLETHPRGGGRDPQVAAAKEAARIEGVMGSDKWSKMDPRMRQSLWDRYQSAVKTAGEKVNPSIQSFVKDTVSAPPLAKGKTDKFAGRRLTLALRTLNEVDPMTGTLKHNPILPEQLTVRAPAFATAYKTYGPEGQAMMQQEYPKDYQYYLQTQPKPAAKPAPAPAAAPVPAPRAAGGPPVLPPATGVSVPPPAPPPPRAQPPPQRQVRTQPPPQAKQTQTGTVRPPANFNTKQGVPPPQGEDPVVWRAVRRMKPPYQQGSKEWKVWQLFVGQGHSPEEIIAGLKNEPQNQKLARATLKDINDNYLSGMFAKSVQVAAGEGTTKGTAAKPASATAGSVGYGTNVPSAWRKFNWPPGTTGVNATGPLSGTIATDRARYSFHIENGRPRIDARL